MSIVFAALLSMLFIFVWFTQPILSSTQIIVLLESIHDGAEGDWFRSSVSVHGNFLITGNRSDYGSAFIYQLDTSNKSSKSWSRTDKLTMPEDTRVQNSYFGISVDIYDNFAIVGATGVNAGIAGAAYIFEYNGTEKMWNKTLSGTLFADDPSTSDACGTSVAIHKNVAIFGCPKANSETGYAFIYQHNEESRRWNRLIKLMTRDGKASDRFGTNVGINDDFAVVGADGSLGVVYIYDLRNVNANVSGENVEWMMNETTILTNPTEYHTYFGSAFALSRTSNNLVIGAYDPFLVFGGGGRDAGNVYVYDYNIFGINESWYQVAKLEASDSGPGDEFGSLVAISDDHIAVAGVWFKSQVYIFERNNSYNYSDNYSYNYNMNDSSPWNEVNILEIDCDGTGSCVGETDVAIYDNWVMIGTYGEGAAYLCDLNSINHLMININYDSGTDLSITGIDSDNSYISTTVDLCDDNDMDWDSEAISSLQWYPIEGCVDVTFSDCTINDRAMTHGTYEIIIDGDIAAYGGYYDESETNTICIDKNYISYCIVPEFCKNNNNVWTLDESDIYITSYHGLIDSTIEWSNTDDSQLIIYCAGDRSCKNNTFTVCFMYLIKLCGIYVTQNIKFCVVYHCE